MLKAIKCSITNDRRKYRFFSCHRLFKEEKQLWYETGVNMSNKSHNNSPAAQNNEAAWKCLLKLGQVTDMETGSIFRMIDWLIDSLFEDSREAWLIKLVSLKYIYNIQVSTCRAFIYICMSYNN